MLINGHKLYLADVKEPPTLSSWIHYQQSLTDKLQQATGSANIVLLSQQWVKPSWWDKYLLMIDDPVIFQREITMQSQDVAYWYAKTLIPQQCYDLNPDFFNLHTVREGWTAAGFLKRFLHHGQNQNLRVVLPHPIQEKVLGTWHDGRQRGTAYQG